MPLNEVCKTKERDDSKLLHNMRPCCMSTIAFSQGCLRCGRISKSCDFGFQRFFQVRKGGAIWLTRRSGSLSRSPRIQKEVQLPTKISLPGTHPPSQDENRAPEALQSLPSDIWLDGQVGDFLPTGAQLTLNQLTKFRVKTQDATTFECWFIWNSAV